MSDCTTGLPDDLLNRLHLTCEEAHGLMEALEVDEPTLTKLLVDLERDGLFDTLPGWLSGVPTWSPPVFDAGTMTACSHPNLELPPFDPVRAATMTSTQVRDAFPRGHSLCGQCGATVISYASFEHYIAGDW